MNHKTMFRRFKLAYLFPMKNHIYLFCLKMSFSHEGSRKVGMLILVPIPFTFFYPLLSPASFKHSALIGPISGDCHDPLPPLKE